MESNIFHTLHLLLCFFKVTPRFLTKSLMFCTERLARTGCSAFLHCWHSIIVASLPLKIWCLKCLRIAATSLGDHCLFCFLLALFPSASWLTTREKTDCQMVFTQQFQQQKQSLELVNILLHESSWAWCRRQDITEEVTAFHCTLEQHLNTPQHYSENILWTDDTKKQQAEPHRFGTRACISSRY